jgi:hypothetical protein
MTQTPADWLRERGAQNDLVTWASAFDDLDAMWNACPRGDWLLAVAVARGIEVGAIERAMLAAATLALDHVDDDERARSSALLSAPLAERRAAAADLEARSGSAESPAASAALGALAIALSGKIEDAASVPALLAQAAVFDAGDCAMMPAQ